MQKKSYRPYLVAGLIWTALLVVLCATMTAWYESIQPSFQEEFGQAPKEDIKYVCPGYSSFLEIFFNASEQRPCALGEKALAVVREYAQSVYVVLWILIALPYSILSSGLDARDFMDFSFWIAVFLCPWIFIPLVGYGISRFGRWKGAEKSHRSEPPLAPPS